MRRLAITTGDPDGVGPEVTAKALRFLGPQPGVQWVIFRDPSSSAYFEKLPFRRRQVTSWEEAKELALSSRNLIEIVNSQTPGDWVETATLACLKKQMKGLVTGPLSKTGLQKSGRTDLGHTEILSRLAGGVPVIQGYLGQHFHVLLATAHVPLKKVSESLSDNRVKEVLKAAGEFRSLLPAADQKKAAAWVAMNPHGGEEGLLGDEDLRIQKVLRKFRSFPVEGPLVPDAAFRPAQWKKYSFYIASYHDQGLIPFKMIHGQSEGAQISLGLPFIRTSVDHGTARDIAGKNLANPGSMIDAIRWCVRLTKG